MRARTGEARLVSVIAIGLMAALIAITVLAPAADARKHRKKQKKVERVEEQEYLGATGFRGVADSPCVDESVGCTVFEIEEGERWVSIEITDDAGQPVWASVYVHGYTDGSDAHEHVCGSSDVPFRLRDGLDELVVVLTQTTAGVTHPCEGPATTGTVTATFSNIR